MTITKTLASKLIVAFVAVAMVFTAFASSAKAQTTEDLQKMINDLLAQVAALQSQTGQGGTSVASGVCPYTWTRDLAVGATGADVMKLQQFLNADLDTRVAAEGAGSVGMETEYYGPATAAAVSKMQVKYRADILSPANLVNPTGYFGPSSRAKANSICVVAPVVDDSSDDSSSDDSDDSSSDDSDDRDLGGEASLDKMEIDSASDDQLEEGAEDAEIAEVTVEFADGDAEISRIDIALVADGGNDELEPWDVFETISLWVDGDKIAEENADDQDDYLNDDDGSLRFSGLDLVGMEDEEVEIVIAATLQGNLDGMTNGEEWNVSVEALRFFDADGVATTETSNLDFGDAVSFTIEESGFEDELIVKTSTNDPDSATLQVENDSKSDWYTVFVFDLDTDDSVNDIELDTIKINVEVASTTGVTFADIVDDAELIIDGVTIDDFTASATAGSLGATSTLTFDVDGDVVIDAGDRVEAELMLRFKSLDAGNEGITVKAEITSTLADLIVAEGSDDLDDTQTSGAAEGDIHTLRTSGIDVSKESTSATATSREGENDYATYEIEVEITAFEQDVYISTDDAVSITYTLEDSAGSTTFDGVRTVVLESTADEVAGYFEITEGSTETLTLTVTYTPGAQTAARLVLNNIKFDDVQTATPAQVQNTLPETDYRTSVVNILD